MLPASRRTTLAKWLHAYDPSVTAPGNATVNTCRILVPFAHRLLAAKLTCNDIDKAVTVGVGLMQADAGDAKAGTIVGASLADADLDATVDVVSVFDFTLAAADKVEAAADRMYHLALVGADAGDHIEQPTLSILVEPLPRAAL